MVDVASLEKIPKVILNEKPSQAFINASLDLKRTMLKTQPYIEGAVSLRPFTESVQKWEEENSDKLSPDEFDNLNLLSQVFRSMSEKIDLDKIDTPESVLESKKRGVEMQRKVVKMVFENLTDEMLPNKKLLRNLSIISTVFEDKLLVKPDPIYERGLARYTTYWQGIMGMVTVAQMFNKIGWQIGFGDVDMDVGYDVDFLVVSPFDEMFSVDVSTSALGYRSGDDLYSVEYGSDVEDEVRQRYNAIGGKIKVKIPPISSYNFGEFYDSQNRGAGVPSKSTLDTLKIKLKNLL